MQRDNVRKGLLVKLLADYANVPAGTWATIDSTGTIPNKFPRGVTEYGINLWEHDLGLFEVVSAEEEQASRRAVQDSPPIRPPAPRLDGTWQNRKRSRVHTNQLNLFGADDY